MKRTSLLLIAFILLPTFAAQAYQNRERSRSAFPRAFNIESRRPALINMDRGFSGGNNRLFPSEFSRPAFDEGTGRQPSYGIFQWTKPARSWDHYQRWTPAFNRGEKGPGVFSRPDLSSYRGSGVRAAVVVHHHAYTPGFVRDKLRKIGVTSEPRLITDRSEIIHTDRQHSTIEFPREGPDHNSLRARDISARHFNDPVVRGQMSRLESADWRERVNRYNSIESQRAHYYWHHDQGFDSCHYIDPWGYDWWGWYMGDQFFWTRYYESRWWWYDTGFDRWCFWNDGYWWWQDPFHVGDLYCYNDDNYIPCNSADDQVVVTIPNESVEQIDKSPEGTRVVKVIGDSQDAFLFDAANPAGFDPVYLASGVQRVEFSNAGKGHLLEIVLKLKDGSFDVFDGYGNAYYSGASVSDKDAEEEVDGTQPLPAPAPTPESH